MDIMKKIPRQDANLSGILDLDPFKSDEDSQKQKTGYCCSS